LLSTTSLTGNYSILKFEVATFRFQVLSTTYKYLYEQNKVNQITKKLAKVDVLPNIKCLIDVAESLVTPFCRI